MKNLIIIQSLLILFFFSASSVLASEQEFTPAKLVEKVSPRYPKPQQRSSGGSRRDFGLVDLIFMVDEHGKPYEISVRRSTSSIFEEEAIRTIARYEYKPASLNSVDLSSKSSARVVFKYSRPIVRELVTSDAYENWRTRTVPDGFMSHYNKLNVELEKSESSEYEVKRRLRKMSELRDQTSLSLVHMELSRFKHADRFGTPAMQVDALYRVLLFDDIIKFGKPLLDERVRNTVVQKLLKLSLEQGHSVDALELYENYLGQVPRLNELFSNSINKIGELQESDSLIERKLLLTARGDVHLPLFKRVFTIDQVVGELHAIKLRCDANFAEMQYKEGAQFALPVSWGNCHLQLIGEPGTTASVLQQ